MNHCPIYTIRITANFYVCKHMYIFMHMYVYICMYAYIYLIFFILFLFYSGSSECHESLSNLYNNNNDLFLLKEEVLRIASCFSCFQSDFLVKVYLCVYICMYICICICVYITRGRVVYAYIMIFVYICG
jgi:hypothetical protein